jgi:tetratricopeptide (TPR) repeat protein
MTKWKTTGIIATIVIILAIPLYTLKTTYLRPLPDRLETYPVSTFVGSKKCMDCHKKEYDKWLNSHHDLAMDVANETTVLGSFENTVFEYFGVKSRFFRKDNRFFVQTRGPDGKMGEFEIKYTFGVYPLQQYLVPFPGGRLQCLPLAWDVKEKKWYHLYPDEPIDPGDWLYWTNAGQNWNGMCAECHSTNLKKNYNHKNDSYQTTWSDIDVGCEACHGPGSRHVAWSEMPDMARPQTVYNYELEVKTSGVSSRDLVELCAPCHSRRAALGDYTHSEPDLLDSLLPSLLEEGMYFPDGQILEEDYVYGSFTQSKMYDRDVRCSDCHDVHSLKLIQKDNALCLQCHRGEIYDTKDHHFHKKKGEEGEPIKSADGRVLFEVGSGAECVQCHMPGRYYMGIDYRPDHSIRIPRPDLSSKLATPNACNRCHIDKTDEWSNEYVTKWYGPGRRTHYGIIIEAGRKRLPEFQSNLIKLAGDPLYPVVVRATALSLLNSYPGEETTRAFELALMDEEALIRRTTIDSLRLEDPGKQINLIAPMLYDPVKAVRIEAARSLAPIAEGQLSEEQIRVFQAALREYQAAMEYAADFAYARYNLGNLNASLHQTEKAIQNYRAAIHIDDQFYPAKVNLAMLYNQIGQKDEAESILRDVVTSHPELHDMEYSLGLLLAEKKQYDEAAVYLKRAARGMPGRARIHYNLGLLLQHLKRDSEAEDELSKAVTLGPDNMDYLYALTEYYLKRGKFQEAKPIAEQMVARHPAMQVGHNLLSIINRKIDGAN